MAVAAIGVAVEAATIEIAAEAAGIAVAIEIAGVAIAVGDAGVDRKVGNPDWGRGIGRQQRGKRCAERGPLPSSSLAATRRSCGRMGLEDFRPFISDSPAVEVAVERAATASARC